MKIKIENELTAEAAETVAWKAAKEGKFEAATEIYKIACELYEKKGLIVSDETKKNVLSAFAEHDISKIDIDWDCV